MWKKRIWNRFLFISVFYPSRQFNDQVFPDSVLKIIKFFNFSSGVKELLFIIMQPFYDYFLILNLMNCTLFICEGFQKEYSNFAKLIYMQIKQIHNFQYIFFRKNYNIISTHFDLLNFKIAFEEIEYAKR